MQWCRLAGSPSWWGNRLQYWFSWFYFPWASTRLEDCSYTVITLPGLSEPDAVCPNWLQLHLLPGPHTAFYLVLNPSLFHSLLHSLISQNLAFSGLTFSCDGNLQCTVGRHFTVCRFVCVLTCMLLYPLKNIKVKWMEPPRTSSKATYMVRTMVEN